MMCLYVTWCFASRIAWYVEDCDERVTKISGLLYVVVS